MASSFRKKSHRGRGSYPAGTKISLHNNQLLISTGVPSLDSLLGKELIVLSSFMLFVVVSEIDLEVNTRGTF
jgi:hypothetical protein